jgi:hypothetical protein
VSEEVEKWLSVGTYDESVSLIMSSSSESEEVEKWLSVETFFG